MIFKINEKTIIPKGRTSSLSFSGLKPPVSDCATVMNFFMLKIVQ